MPGSVVDGFRPPDRPWSAGNRGVDFATHRGEPVHAAAAGQVAFADQVGGRLVVSIDHADGTRSTYSPLATLAVAAGDRVARGDVIGTASGALHLGVFDPTSGPPRTYQDPLAWLGRPCRAVLVPLDGGQGRAGTRAEGS